MEINKSPTHVLQNREAWTAFSERFLEPGRESWSSSEIRWGIWGVPERSIGALGDLGQWRDRDVVELGCGTAYFSAWFARLGARPVGVDITPAQLANARAFQESFQLSFPLVEASAEVVPLRDESFDLALSEYGASIWCDPYRWVPEAARVLRLGGSLIFLRNSTLSMLCMPDQGPIQSRLCRTQAQLGRIEWPDDHSIEFQIPHGEMIRLLRACGFEIEDLIEIVAPSDSSLKHDEYMTLEWGSRWPSEEIWRAVKRR